MVGSNRERTVNKSKAWHKHGKPRRIPRFATDTPGRQRAEMVASVAALFRGR